MNTDFMSITAFEKMLDGGITKEQIQENKRRRVSGMDEFFDLMVQYCSWGIIVFKDGKFIRNSEVY